MANLISVTVLGKDAQALASDLGIQSVTLKEASVAIFIVSAADGIVGADIKQWEVARELYIPSIVVISETETADLDFEDMSAIASKILDPLITPFLILHADSGYPVALINLQSLVVTDYSTGEPIVAPSETEHRELVAEFREEYLEALAAAGEDAFANALLFPALPWIRKPLIGITEIHSYLNLIPPLR